MRQPRHFSEHRVVGGLKGNGRDDFTAGAAFEFAGVQIKGGKLARLLDAKADGVDSCASGGSNLGGSDGRDLALVVVAIGQHDDEAALAVFEHLEALGGGGGGVADGRAQFADDADVEPVQILNQPIVVEGERAGQVRHS